MKGFVFSVITLISCGYLQAAYNPFVDGARADVCVKVVDDLGKPVPNALVSVVFLTDVQKVNVSKGMSDSGGRYKASGSCIGEIRLWVRKDGYYDTKCHPREFRTYSQVEVVKTRRWSADMVEMRVILKKKRNPVKTNFHVFEFKHYPATNEVLRLDLELMAWCPPYGNGRRDDLHLVYDGWRNPEDWFDFHEHLKIAFPNCVDGFYKVRIDPASDFPYAHVAETNHVYAKELELRHMRKVKGVVESVCLSPEDYLIYRVRTQTNELGQVTNAHYGRIGEKLSQFIGLSMKNWYNAKENDPNLEDARLR